MSDCIYIYQSVSLFPSSQSVPLSFSHSLLTCPSSLMPFHNKSSVPSTSLLKCLHSHFWWVTLPCCHDPDNEMITLGFLILPAGVKAWPLVKSHSPYSCSKWFWIVSSPLHLAPAVVRSSPRYDHKVCVHGPTTNCDFNFWCYMSLKCIRMSSPGPLFHTTNNQSFHPTFTFASDNRYSIQLPLRHFFVI